MCRSDTMKKHWQDPEFREKVITAQKEGTDALMKKKLREIARREGKSC